MLKLYQVGGRLGTRVVPAPGRLGFGRQWARQARVVARRPVRVHSPIVDEAQQALEHYEKMFAQTMNDQNSKRSQKKHDEFEERKDNKNMKEKHDEAPDVKKHIKFKLFSEASDYISKLLGNMSSHKFREKNKLFVGEGVHIIKEALKCGAHPEAIYFTRFNQLVRLVSSGPHLGLLELNTLNALPLYRTPYKTMQTWSSLTTSPGISGVFKVPTPCEPKISHPLKLVVDEIREPANLGGILRTAAAVGITDVILMKGCCDPWERKVVRAGCGAHFRLQLHLKVTWDKLANFLPDDAQVLVADICHSKDLEDDTVEDSKKNWPHNTITNPGRSEPFDHSYQKEAHEYEIDDQGKKVLIDTSYNDEEYLLQYENAQLPVRYYDKLKVSSASGFKGGSILVIGGETGLSNAAKRFTIVNNGIKVSIPLANGMDSLNSSVAAGVIMYEIGKNYIVSSN